MLAKVDEYIVSRQLRGSTAKRQKLASVAHIEPAIDQFEEHRHYYHLQQSAPNKVSFQLKTGRASDKAAESFGSLNYKGQRAEQQPGEDADIDQAYVWRTI